MLKYGEFVSFPGPGVLSLFGRTIDNITYGGLLEGKLDVLHFPAAGASFETTLVGPHRSLTENLRGPCF